MSRYKVNMIHSDILLKNDVRYENSLIFSEFTCAPFTFFIVYAFEFRINYSLRRTF